jgi:hypothetical protein
VGNIFSGGWLIKVFLTIFFYYSDRIAGNSQSNFLFRANGYELKMTHKLGNDGIINNRPIVTAFFKSKAFADKNAGCGEIFHILIFMSWFSIFLLTQKGDSA